MDDHMTVLQCLGWGTAQQQHFDPSSMSMDNMGRVVSEHRGRYRVWSAAGQQWVWPPQGMRRKVSSLDKPGVGDWVALRPGQQGDLPQITALLPRKTALTRQAAGERAEPQLVAANLDAVFVVTSFNQDFNLRRLERYLSVIHAGGVQPIVVVNKADLVSVDAQQQHRDQLAVLSADIPVRFTSALHAADCAGLLPWLGPGRTVGLVGSSGVGKSSLVNTLQGASTQEVGDIRQHDDRGRHTTTHRELVLLPNNQGILLDTPGMRELQLWTGESIDDVFVDVTTLLDEGCLYRDCRHNGEPGCVIAAALESGSLSPERWDSYQKLHTEGKSQAKRRTQFSRQQSRHPHRKSKPRRRR